MNYNKEKLEKLLKLIVELSNDPQNEWFKNRLTNIYVKNITTTNLLNQSSLETRITLIQEYLLIDIDNLIDYSSFDEPSREQLFRDNLEMMRFQKGTPNHKVNFGEFCRYAHLQAEEMINYFLNKITNSKIEMVEMFMKQYSPNYNPSKRPTDIHHINYTHKLIAFKNAKKISKKTIDALWFINDIRNELSHRNSLSMHNENNILVQFEKEGFLRMNIDFKKLSNKQLEIFNKGNYIITKRKEDFNSIKKVIEELKELILSAIQNPPVLNDNKSTFESANPVLIELRKKLEGK